MQMNRVLVGSMIVAAAAMTPVLVAAQARSGGPVKGWTAQSFEILSIEPEDIPTITNAPFTAEAATEFTQTLSDGNRIERRYTTSLARDGRGRTRREQDVAILNPVVMFQGVHVQTQVVTGGAHGAPVNWTVATHQNTPPRLLTISDPVEGASYSLDEQRKEARRSSLKIRTIDFLKQAEMKKIEAAAADGSHTTVVEPLGTRQFEGVSAEGVRSTTTIPAGEIGNLNPIHLVTERWFSKELQMAVLITRKDPRSGDTTYRLTNVVRTEPPPDLFTVPADYRVIEPRKANDVETMREIEKIRKALEERQLNRAK
jgi:hypothetical protein